MEVGGNSYRVGVIEDEVQGVSIIDLVVPSLDEGAMDSEGFMLKVTLYPTMFSSSLRRPFCHPIRDVLDFVGAASAQLCPNSWRILMCYYIIWRCALEEARSDRPDLTT